MSHDHRFSDGTYCGGDLVDYVTNGGPVSVNGRLSWSALPEHLMRCAACGLTGVPFKERADDPRPPVH